MQDTYYPTPRSDFIEVPLSGATLVSGLHFAEFSSFDSVQLHINFCAIV